MLYVLMIDDEVKIATYNYHRLLHVEDQQNIKRDSGQQIDKRSFAHVCRRDGAAVGFSWHLANKAFENRKKVYIDASRTTTGIQYLLRVEGQPVDGTELTIEGDVT